MTPDLQRLQQSSGMLGPIIERLELELVDDPAWFEPSDTSYLSPSERENPDIAANIAAMAETNKLIAWFGKDADGYVGMWRGPTERAIDQAPVVRLDTEGQYSIVAATIPEYIAISVPEDEFAQVRDALLGLGFKVGNNPDAIWGALDAFTDDPNQYRNQLYQQNKAKHGVVSEIVLDDLESDATAVPEPNGASEQESAAFAGLAGIAADAADDAGDFEAADDAGELDDADDDTEVEVAPEPVKPATKAPAKTAVKAATKKPAKKAAAKKPAKKAAAKKAAKKAAAKKPAKKAAAKKPAKKAAAKQPAKKAAAKKTAAKQPAKKSAAKKPVAKKIAKPARKKR